MKKILYSLIFLLILSTTFLLIKNNVVPGNIGLEEGMLSEMPTSPNAVSSMTDIKDKKVEPLLFIGNLENSKTKIVEIIKNYKGTKIITDEKNYMHVVFKTDLMRFKDDVEFYFDETNGLIHFRSESRLGYSDMGLNRNRYNEIKEKYNE